MSLSKFKNPFEKAKKRKKDDAELVGELLGPEEEAEMREAMGVQAVEKEAERDDTIRLTEEEEAAKKKVEEELTPEQRRKEYYEWATEFGKGEDWVNKTFTFNDDGGVEVERALDLDQTGATRFPKGLKSIGGYLGLRECTGLTSLEGLPASIGVGLYLKGCTGVDDIPEGVNIKGTIYLDKTQTELKANAEAKGYKTKVI